MSADFDLPPPLPRLPMTPEEEQDAADEYQRDAIADAMSEEL